MFGVRRHAYCGVGQVRASCIHADRVRGKGQGFNHRNKVTNCYYDSISVAVFGVSIQLLRRAAHESAMPLAETKFNQLSPDAQL